MRIFVACADERLRLALLVFLDQAPGMTVAGMSDRFEGLFAQLEGSQPDVLLLDWELLGEPKAGLLAALHGSGSRPQIIVLSASPEEKERVMEAGADYCICKNAPPDGLLPILDSIRRSKSSARNSRDQGFA